jgi:hypothetical protein
MNGYAIVFGSITVLVAAFGAFIAYRQWRTAQDKMILDLFDRRYAVFSGTISALYVVIRDEGRSQNLAGLVNMAETLDKARFLFGPEVISFLDDLNKSMKELVGKRNYYGNARTDQERVRLSDELASEEEALSKKDVELRGVVEPYMAMRHRAQGASFPKWKDLLSKPGL